MMMSETPITPIKMSILKIPSVALAVVLAMSGCSSSTAPAETDNLNCDITVNGIYLQYPCGDSRPTAPTGGTLITAWSDVIEPTEMTQLVLERHETSLGASEWAELHLNTRIEGTDPSVDTVSGRPALVYQTIGSGIFDTDSNWFVLIEEPPASEAHSLYVITMTASSKEEVTRTERQGLLLEMLHSIVLPEMP